MKAARGDYARRIDWSAAKGDKDAHMRRQVLRFVAGIRGERKNDPTTKEILAWFAGTPESFVHNALLDCIGLGLVGCGRRSLQRRTNSATVYWLKDEGRRVLNGATDALRKAVSR